MMDILIVFQGPSPVFLNSMYLGGETLPLLGILPTINLSDKVQ